MKNWNFINGWSLKIGRVNRAIVLSMLMMILSQPMFSKLAQAKDDLTKDQLISEEQPPSIEFLEFLGGGVTVEKEFLDPMNYTEIDTGTKQDKTQQVGNDKIQKDDE